MKTTLLFAKMQLARIFRDPVTLIVLFAIPMLLLLLFGAFTANTDALRLRVATVNQSNETVAQEFVKGLDTIEVLKQSDEKLTIDEARKKMRNHELDGIIALPADFGTVQDALPRGSVKVYVDETDTTTGDILSSVVNSAIDETNKHITGSAQPISLEKISISSTGASIFDGLFAMFSAMAIMMVGIFGVGSSIPADKKAGILRRLRATPLRSSQIVLGTMLAYAVIAILAIALMTVLALTVFGLTMRGSWLDYSLFTLLATVLMLGFGLAIGGWAKNSTQADIYGQIVFISSLAFSGLWVPRALMPEWLQDITAYLPLTPIIDGIRSIVAEGIALTSLGSELAVIGIWAVVVFIVGIKTFKWE
jgi:ABC-2 type transport system permease protein